jgi:hypothetical protein
VQIATHSAKTTSKIFGESLELVLSAARRATMPIAEVKNMIFGHGHSRSRGKRPKTQACGRSLSILFIVAVSVL